MPNNVVKTKKQEKLWKKAEKIADKQGQKENYAYIMGIYKKMGGLKENYIEDIIQGMAKEITEAMSLEDAMEKPAALWIQGLKDKEYNKLLKIMNSDYNEAYTTKKLQKAFPDLTGSLMSEFRRLCMSIIKDKIPKDKIHTKGFKGNFLGIGLSIDVDKGVVLEKGFDEIRN